MGHQCMCCGEDISKYNLDFKRDIVCGGCVQRLIPGPNMTNKRPKRTPELRTLQPIRDGMGYGKIKCEYCGEIKDDLDITLDNSKVARYICEDCYAKNKTP